MWKIKNQAWITLLKFTYLFLLFLALFSCEKKVSVIQFRQSSVPLGWKTLDVLKQNYRFYHQNKDQLVFYDQVRHQFIRLNINDQKIDSIRLDLNGPNGIGDISSFFYHNQDSIFATDANGIIYLLNEKGFLIDQADITSLPSSKYEDLYTNFPDLSFTNKLIYFPDQGQVLNYFQKFEDEENKSIFALYDFAKKSLKPLPIDYSDFIAKFPINPYLFDIDVEAYDDAFFLIFSGDPRVYKYSLKSKKVISKLVPTDFTKVQADPPSEKTIDFQLIRNFLKENPFYGKIVFDNNSKLLYRFSIPPMRNLPDDESLYSFNKIFVSILDEDLKLLAEGYLDKENTYNFNFLFVFKDGIWIAYKEDLQDDESLLKGDLIHFQLPD